MVCHSVTLNWQIILGTLRGALSVSLAVFQYHPHPRKIIILGYMSVFLLHSPPIPLTIFGGHQKITHLPLPLLLVGAPTGHGGTHQA
jgi:hypothetical protein